MKDYEKICVSCKECLGWVESNRTKIVEKDLNEHIKNIIDKHIRKIEDTKRKQELAKEICGIEE